MKEGGIEMFRGVLKSVALIFLVLLNVSVYAQEKVAAINIPFSTYFARVQVSPVYQMINRASVAFGEKNLKGTEYEGLPVISRQSTTHGGFRGAADFLNLPAGDLTFAEISQIYRYNNTIQALKINGSQIIEWLEKSGGNFNQINPESTADQLLINYGFDGHHLDQFWGITYMYDVTQPLGKRVVKAEYQGKPLSADMVFIVMSDNYRAGGGAAFPHAVPENIVMKWDYNCRNVVIDYLNSIAGIVPELVVNWSIKPVKTKGRVIVQTGAEWGTPVLEYMETAAELNLEPVNHVEYVGTEDVWGLFAINLSAIKTP
jgi:hypothetical protein